MGNDDMVRWNARREQRRDLVSRGASEEELLAFDEETDRLFPAPRSRGKSVEEIARGIREGIYGNGEQRIENLRLAGYDDDTIRAAQDLVNRQIASEEADAGQETPVGQGAEAQGAAQEEGAAEAQPAVQAGDDAPDPVAEEAAGEEGSGEASEEGGQTWWQRATSTMANAAVNNSLSGNNDKEGEEGEEEGEGGEEENKKQGGFLSALGDTFGRYFGGIAAQGRVGGVDPSGVSASNRRIAELREQNAQELQKASQQNAQIANRNYVDEANRLAAAQAAQKNRQTVANRGNVSAGAAALARGTETADYNTHMNRSDAQRREAVQNLNAANAQRQAAEQERISAKRNDYRAGQLAARNAESDWLSGGPLPGGEGGGGRSKKKKETRPPFSFGVQNVINYVLGSSRRYRTDDKGNIIVNEQGDRVWEEDPAAKAELDALSRRVIEWYCTNIDPEAAAAGIWTPLSAEEQGDAPYTQWADIYSAKGEHHAAFLKWLAAMQGGTPQDSRVDNDDFGTGQELNSEDPGASSDAAIRALEEIHNGATAGSG